jgi:glucose-1-phosphate thymidylyltransferase
MRTLEERQGLMVACLEEIAFKMGFIDGEQLRRLAESMRGSSYGTYLRQVLEDA